MYTNFSGLILPKYDIEYKFFTVILIDSLLLYGKKYYVQVYLDDCAYEIGNKQRTDYLDISILLLIFQYWYLNISIAIVMENTKMLKFVPDSLKTKTVKKIPYLLRYVFWSI